MDRFKEKVGDIKSYEITQENFYNVTKKRKPYYQVYRDKTTYYAVCPACDNPIQIIGLYKNTPESGRKPYGRHNLGTIPDLAVYDEDEYLQCPYANPNRKNRYKYRRPGSKAAGRIYNLLRRQFDRVIHLLQKDMDMVISDNTARNMLEQYLSDQGYFYRVATLYNIPWVLAFATGPRTLYGRKIIKGSELHTELERQCPEISFEEKPGSNGYVYIRYKDTRDITIEYGFHNYRQDTGADDGDNESIRESLVFEVFRCRGKTRHENLYQKTIVVDSVHFMNLVCMPEEKARRNQRLLDIAAEIMPDSMPELEQKNHNVKKDDRP